MSSCSWNWSMYSVTEVIIPNYTEIQFTYNIQKTCVMLRWHRLGVFSVMYKSNTWTLDIPTVNFNSDQLVHILFRLAILPHPPLPQILLFRGPIPAMKILFYILQTYWKLIGLFYLFIYSFERTVHCITFIWTNFILHLVAKCWKRERKFALKHMKYEESKLLLLT